MTTKNAGNGAAGGLCVAILLFWAALVADGAGHGSFTAAKLFFPYPMLLVMIWRGTIGPIALILAAFQWALYGAAVGGASKHRVLVIATLVGTHVSAVAVCFSMHTDIF